MGLEVDESTWTRVGLAPLMATLLLPIIIGVILLLKCVFNNCCFRRTNTKEEMYGLEGRMTMLPNPDTSFAATPNPQQDRSAASLSPTSSLLGVPAVGCPPHPVDKLKTAKVLINNNHPIISTSGGDYHPAAVTDPSQPHLPIPNADSDLSDTLKRATTGKRQLPDLPQIPLEQLGHPPRRSSSVLSHDGTSELYATVGEVPNPPSRSGIINPYAHLMSRTSSKPSTSRGVNGIDGEIGGQGKSSIEPAPSSDSETYATANHPYAKLKRNPAEHPYARVRNSSLANDEETDTDNYDLPQPYAQTRGRQAGGSMPNSQPGSNQPSASSSSSANVVDGPVPPRRIGRQWRRGSHPQGQHNNDTTQHFSGDSQDSRGYTSISVREPLSNIRNQQVANTRLARQDSHYATVSDDSEEMYAAIDDTEGNYMQIQDGASRPSWLDAANVASPIPERREANSPLPPVPAVPPPEVPGIPGSAPPTSPLLSIQNEIVPPVYAQVTKKSKKAKAPVTPTASNASTSSQIQDVEPEVKIPDPEIIIRPTAPVASSSSTHHSHQHHHQSHHRSKSRTLMDNSNLLEAGLSEPRRWSKADISYSEFEVVREGLVPSDLKSPNTLSISSSTSMERQERTISPRESIASKISLKEELVDEDNYNVIPDKHDEGRISRSSKRSSGGKGGGSKSKSRRERVDSDNYQEIEPISNTYQEIGGGRENSDHYQEIGMGSSSLPNGNLEDDDDGGSGLYQEIQKKDEYEEEEDDDDQLYEKVKPSTSKSQLAVPGGRPNRKHGYEKIKRKGAPPSPQRKGHGSDEEDDEDDEEIKPEDDDMYERVKYPPYERLKESRSDLAMNAVLDDEENDFYEHIGYSKVKPKSKVKQPTEEPKHVEEEAELSGDLVDVNQLYAVVDKTKKKKNTSSISNMNNSSNNNNNNPIIEDNLSPFSGDRHNLTGRDSTMSTRSSSRTDGSPRIKPELSVNAVSDLNFIDDSIDIEYI